MFDRGDKTRYRLKREVDAPHSIAPLVESL
jgi:hypothetical protein